MNNVGKILVWSGVLALSLAVLPVHAQQGDPDNGEVIYFEHCVGCHGEDGDGAGPAAERLNPPPRDFSEGAYKFKTTGFDDFVPNDADLYRMISDGMPGTAMPDWSDVLSETEMWDLVAYIKIFAGLEEEEPTDQIDYGTQIATSAESIARGRDLFHESQRCSECHGHDGRGDAVKKLKDDGGERTWPRNMTKPWTFRASNDPRDIFTRMTVGIPGTQMPSFDDPVNKKRLSIDDRWHVANYVTSLAETERVPRAENTVIKAVRVDGGVPAAPDDARWAEIAPTTFLLVPQIIADERLFTPSNDTISARVTYDDETLAILLEWDDRTQSIPGDTDAEAIADPNMGEDSVAVQFPVAIPGGVEKPYFGMGDASNPVNIWRWSSGTTEEPESAVLMNARGFADIVPREAAAAGLQATGTYTNGTWRVVMTRPLTPVDVEADIGFEEGRFIPIAFAAWDGSNAERGSRHTLTTWYWLLLEPPGSARPIIVALLIAALIAAGEAWWQRSATARRRKADV
uniref:Cytochrome c-552/DMSO reductase-like, haem-binding domain protein n=1 Tax=uncultured Pseudomonadota bacterium TaxID=153809 RepID=A0A2P0QJH7_9PROT|nr:cytochrome c-552/DMSO reductase-like, haem-binding domain protein [uncultured proteobacterium]